MLLDIILLSLAIILCIVGVVGAIVPGVPGPPISFVGFLLFVFCPGLDASFPATTSVLVTLLLAIVVTVLDFVAPVWFTKLTGGSKAGVWGATIGMIAGLVVSCLGFFIAILIGPFIGAYLGEKYAGASSDNAFRVACYSFLSFILTTGVKLLYSFAVMAVVVYKGVSMFFA